MNGEHAYEVLFRRHDANPILTAADWPYPVHTVFNPGATRLRDGTTLLLCRVEDRRGHSHLCAARSRNGVDGWRIDPHPTLRPEPEIHHEELWGIEDPRITWVAELEKYVVAYTAFSRSGPGVALALTGSPASGYGFAVSIWLTTPFDVVEQVRTGEVAPILGRTATGIASWLGLMLLAVGIQFPGPFTLGVGGLIVFFVWLPMVVRSVRLALA